MTAGTGHMSRDAVATSATVVAQRAAGAYHVLTIAAPDIVAAAEPGQFVSVGVDTPTTLLRRPFAIAGVETGSGLLDLAIAVVGTGSAWLAARHASTVLDVTGPLGSGFVAPARPARCLLVGGGYGVAALAWLAQRLTTAGHRVELLSGARSAAALYPLPPTSPDDGVALFEATQDGGRGHAGLVTDLLADRFADGGAQGERGTAVFACGPMAMLAAVARIAADHGCPCQVAVEEHMGCSVGVCMTCVVPTVQGYVRACIDGPVLDGRRVDWSSVSRRDGGSRTHPPSGDLRDDRTPRTLEVRR